MTEFVPVNAAALAAVDVEMPDVELEDLSDDAVAAEGTQELGGADILEVEHVAKKLDALDAKKPNAKIEISMDAKNKELSEVFGAISLRKPQKTLVGVGIGVPRPPVPRPPVPQVPRIEARATTPVMLPPPAPTDGLPILVPSFRPPQGAFAPLPPPVPPPRSPSRHPSHHASQPSYHPSSISPLALDIAEPPPIESTMQIRRAAGIPDRARPELAIAAGIAAWAVMAASVALVLGGTFVGIRRHSAAKATAAAALSAPRAPVAVAEPNIPPVPEEKVAVAEKPATPGPAAAPAPISLPSTPSVRRAAPPPRVSGKPAGVAGAQTGVLRVPAGVRGVLVDGAPHKVDGGALFLPCGKHMIKAPGQASRSVDIVCGKTVSL